MSVLVQDLNGIIPFTQGEYAVAIIHIIFGLVGTTLGIIILILAVSDTETKSMKLYASLLIADIALSVSVLIVDAINLNAGGFAISPSFCAAQSITVLGILPLNLFG